MGADVGRGGFAGFDYRQRVGFGDLGDAVLREVAGVALGELVIDGLAFVRHD